MKKGKITTINQSKNFIKIDYKYYFPFKKLNFTPSINDNVEYEVENARNSTKAINVRKISNYNKVFTSNSNVNVFREYLAFLEDGYFKEVNNKRYIKDEYLIKFPMSLSKIFASDSKVNKNAQINKFYYVFKHLENLYKIKKDFENIKVELLKYLPIAKKSQQRGHISKDFLTFLEKNINMAINSEYDFTNGFIPHMQSFMGYFDNK